MDQTHDLMFQDASILGLVVTRQNFDALMRELVINREFQPYIFQGEGDIATSINPDGSTIPGGISYLEFRDSRGLGWRWWPGAVRWRAWVEALSRR